MNKAHWVLEDNQILIKSHSGDTFLPVALQVYSAVFSGVDEFHGHKLDRPLSSELPNLIFSRFPAEPAIIIRNITPLRGISDLHARNKTGSVVV